MGVEEGALVLPAGGAVTGLAIEAELAGVGIAVAVGTGGADEGELEAAVAVAATGGGVGAVEPEAGGQVLEPEVRFQRSPVADGVAQVTVEVEAVAVGMAGACQAGGAEGEKEDGHRDPSAALHHRYSYPKLPGFGKKFAKAT